MKIDEAISLLKQYIDYNNPDIPDFYTMEEACKVVINALEQQVTDAVDRVTIKEYLESYNGVKTELEPCADMVSRDAMWEVLQRLYGTEGELVEELMSLPPVLPMPKMGKWIYRKEEDSYRCSLCTYPCHKDNLGAIPTKYCAGCGAVMEV